MKKTTAAITALILGGAGSLALAVPAFAHDNSINAQCDRITLTLTNYPNGSTVSGTLDGADLGTQAFGGSLGNYYGTVNIDPYIVHTYSVDVVSGDHQKRYDLHTGVLSTTPCAVPTPPVTEPPVTEPPVTEPPVTAPPTDEPTVPPTDTPTEPPVTTPPTDEPTEPPVTTPPTEEPTSPPTTEPPVTEEPTPPSTTPPVTEEPQPTDSPVPPVTDEPTVPPTTDVPPVTDKPGKDKAPTLEAKSLKAAKADKDSLAFTGTDDTQRNLIVGTGLLLLLSGIGIGVGRIVRTRRS